jgi:BMFP domain-containing protein YqiC
MLDDMRKFVEAALGQMSPSHAREVAQSILKGEPTEQVNRFARDLAGWSQRARERVAELVRSEVQRQLKAMGVVTRDDLDAVRARIRDLEKAGGRSRTSGRRASGAKTSSSKRSAARSSTRKTSATRKPGAKTSAAKQTAARTSTAQTATREGART